MCPEEEIGTDKQENKLLFLRQRMNHLEIHLKYDKMKQGKIWILGVFSLVLSACEWGEEPTLAELYAGTYRGALYVSSPAGEEVTDGRVEMTVAGDRTLQLRFTDIKWADETIDSLVIPALLSLDGQNRLAGKRGGINWAEGQVVHAEIEGEMVYDESELTVLVNVGTEGAVPTAAWVLKFRGTRK